MLGLKRKIRGALGQEPHIDLIVKLCLATHEVETTHALQGLGGCVAKSFKDVLSQGD